MQVYIHVCIRVYVHTYMSIYVCVYICAYIHNLLTFLCSNINSAKALEESVVFGNLNHNLLVSVTLSRSEYLAQ